MRNFLMLIAFMLFQNGYSSDITLKNKYSSISINDKGFVTSIKDLKTNKDYSAKTQKSPLMSVYIWSKRQQLDPTEAKYNSTTGQFVLKYPNGTIATVKVNSKEKYFRFELVAMENRGDVDNVIWGPYRTTISQTIGEIIGVVRDGSFAFGAFSLNDNTTAGVPVDNDLYDMFYYIHTPDAKKYPVPSNLKEGQRLSLGGAGHSDIDFYSKPEEYYRINYGNAAVYKPEYGTEIAYHARDRRKEHTIFYSLMPLFPINKRHHQVVEGLKDVDLLHSAVALYACPDQLGLSVLETIVKQENMPYITNDKGKWIKDFSAYSPDIAWSGVHDSLVSYSKQIGFKGVQDEGQGGGYSEYYYNPGDRFGGMKGKFKDGKTMDIRKFGASLKKEGLQYGVHTLCEFIQGNSSDVTPIPNKNLSKLYSVKLEQNIAAKDTTIRVQDTMYLNERGVWHQENFNVLKIGDELITYKGVTKSRPFTLTGVQRGAYKTFMLAHQKGDEVSKLQGTCYSTFIPNMELQDQYGKAYANLLKETSMDYIDFDGLESCMYQGHGEYAFKRFFRSLFEQSKKNGIEYLRVMGSCVFEGNWLYMSTCNIGGGNHMFNPETGKWGIEGKDMRYVFHGNYMPATFGIQGFPKNEEVAHNLQCKAIGWNAQYMLGMSQESVEKNPEKYKIFKAIRAWQTAREADVFTDKQKESFQSTTDKFKIEQKNSSTWTLYTQKEGKGKWISEQLTKPLTIANK
jgi:hypothetical protein